MPSVLTSVITDGMSSTTKIDGKINSTIGNSILTGAFMASDFTNCR